MKKSRFTETQIIPILKQADAAMPVKDICRQAGISVPTYYQWKAKHGGLEASKLSTSSLLAEYSAMGRASMPCHIVSSHASLNFASA